jgi:TonB-linked SusC/RagA family outer membrane protein
MQLNTFNIGMARLWLPQKLLLIMKLVIIILTTVLMQVSAAGLAQTITLKEKETPLKQVFQNIRTQTGYDFLYDTKLIEKAKRVSIQLDKVSLESALTSLFEGRDLTYTIKDKFIVIKEKAPSFLDQIKSVFADVIVRGRIVDENGNALVGASIQVKGKAQVYKSNENGQFSIPNVPEDAILVIRYIGYKALEISVKGASMPLEIKLDTQTGELQEVNVTYNTGYQTLSRESATGSVNVIDNEKFNEQVGTNVLTRLPAIANSIIILPKSSRNGSNTMVMRGVQTIGGPVGPLIVLDDFPYDGDLNNINPNDIENITLLKDASATSIWGAKAGNGVIVITTKKGKLNQRVKVDVNSSLTVIDKPDLFYLKRASSSEHIELEKFLFSNGFYDSDLENLPHSYQTKVVDILEKQRNKQISDGESAAQLLALSNQDIRKEAIKYIYEPGVNQQYSVSLRGGSDNLGWLLSVGYDKNRNELGAGYARNTLRLDNTYKPFKKMVISAGANFTYSKNTSGKVDVLNSYNVPPYSRLFDDQGHELSINREYRQAFIATAGHGKLLDWTYYPLQDYKLSVNRVAIKSVTGNLGVNYVIIPGLHLDLKYRLQLQQQKGRLMNEESSFFTRLTINKFTTINNLTQAVSRPVPIGGILDLNDRDVSSHNLRGQLNWDKSWGKNNITGIVGSEFSTVVTDNYTNRYYGYKDDLLLTSTVDYLRAYPYFIQTDGSGFISNPFRISQFKNKFISQYANVAYAYDNKYILTGSARKDGANLFGVETNNKWNLIWSAGAAWDISKEQFYSSIFLPYLKFRASYGFGGNVLPNASSRTTLSYSGISEFTGGQIARASGFLNPDLRWEKNRTINLGLDFKFINNRVSGSFEYYNKNGTDLYNNRLIDRTLGLARNFLQTNNGNINGNGVDVILNSLNIDGKIKWQSDFKFSFYDDKVTDIYNPSNAAYNFIGGEAIAKGYSRFALFAYKWAGLKHETGDPQGYLNGKPSTDYAALYGDSATLSDLTHKGSTLPKYFGSLGNMVSFKNFSLSVRMTYALGYYFINESFDYGTSIYSRILHQDFSNRWKEPGDEKNTNIPSFTYDEDGIRSYFYKNAEVNLQKGDHIRLQYINLSYSINRSTLPKLPFSNLRISVIANDLGILWKANKLGIDPTNVSSIPIAKSFVLNINANF